MSTSIEKLIQLLEVSVKKHGADKPLTIGHLLNLLKKVKSVDVKNRKSIEQRLNQVMDDHYRYDLDRSN